MTDLKTTGFTGNSAPAGDFEATPPTPRQLLGVQDPDLQPGAVLPSRAKIWQLVAAIGIIATVGGAAAGTLTGTMPVAPVAVTGIALTALLVVPAYRIDRRHELVDKVREQLNALLGYPQQSRAKVRTFGWSGGAATFIPRLRLMAWTPVISGPLGSPTKIRIRYARQVRDTVPHPKLFPELIEIPCRIFESTYEVEHHDEVRCLMVLHRVDTTPETSPKHPVPERGMTLIEKYLGADARITASTYRPQEPDDQTAGSDEVVPADDKEALALLSSVEVTVAPTSPISNSNYQRRVEREWSTKMPGRWHATFDPEIDLVRFEKRKPFAEKIPLPLPTAPTPDDPRKAFGRLEIRVGPTDRGFVKTIRPSKASGIAIAGSTGSGKSTLLRNTVLDSAHAGVAVWIIDGKGTNFLDLIGWPNVQIVANKPAEQAAALHLAKLTMDERFRLHVDEGVPIETFMPILVLVDEFVELGGGINGWYSQVRANSGNKGPTKPPVLENDYPSVSRKSREAAIFRIHAMHRMDTRFLPAAGELRLNFPEALILGRSDADGARMAGLDPAVAMSIPQACEGRGSGIDPRTMRTVELHSYLGPNLAAAADTDEGRHLAQFQPTKTFHERLIYVPPAEQGDKKPTYRDYIESGTDDDGNIVDPRWVPASERPDLDPLVLRQKAKQRDDGIDRADPLTILGFARPKQSLENPTETGVIETSETETPTPAEPTPGDAAVDEAVEYHPSTPTALSDVQLGDRILIDDTTDHWAIACADAEPDPTEDDMHWLDWRDDADEEGLLQADPDQVVHVQRPYSSTPS